MSMSVCVLSPLSFSHHPELPQRISKIFSLHEDLGLAARCQRIPTRLATEEELARCHGRVTHTLACLVLLHVCVCVCESLSVMCVCVCL